MSPEAVEAARLARLYGALSQASQAIVRAETPQELLQAVCDALVERGEFPMAWIGWPDADSPRLLPRAQAGEDDGYLQRIVVTTDESPTGCGPAGLAFRSGQHHICNDFMSDPITAPWRSAVGRQPFGAAAVLPIKQDGRVAGVLAVYANEKGFFQDKEVALLQEVVGELSFALDAKVQAQRRVQAELQARHEQLFSSAMIDSMPGVLYFYDERGRFLRWNRNLERVSGYSAEEVARMHPLDFFAEGEKALLASKIAEVFAHGEAEIEAEFVAKDGHRTPYVFTGKRLMYEGVPCLIGVGMDISARRQNQRELEDYASRLQNVSRQLMEVQENERRVLARELHDSVGQELTALSLNLSIVMATLPAHGGEALNLRLQDSLKLLEDTTRNLRHVMVALRPPGLDELGLMAALKEHAQRVAQRSGLKLHLLGSEPRPRLPPTCEIALFRIVQEALNNTVKHARASEIGIALHSEPGLLVLRISDNGRGFAPERPSARHLDRMGMVTMRERADAIGAGVHIDTAPERGTRITVTLPLHTLAQ